MPALEQHIGFDGRIEPRVLLGERIDIDALKHVFRLVLPAHLGVRTRDPQLALRDHVGIVGVMVDDIIEGADGSEEVPFMELRLAQPNPCQPHVGIELFGLEPQFIVGIACLFRVAFGFRFDGMQLDALTAFLDGLVHLRRTGLGCFMVGNRIKVQDLGIVISIGVAYGLQTVFVREVTVVKNVIFDFRLMKRPRRPCVFLGRA